MLVRDALPRGSGGLQFYHPRGVGVGKALLFLSGSSSSSLVSGKMCIQISWRVVLKLLPLVWIWMLAWSHPPPNDLRQFSHLHWSSKPALFWWLSWIYSGLPTSPRFPSLSMISFWDFYNHLAYTILVINVLLSLMEGNGNQMFLLKPVILQ